MYMYLRVRLARGFGPVYMYRFMNMYAKRRARYVAGPNGRRRPHAARVSTAIARPGPVSVDPDAPIHGFSAVVDEDRALVHVHEPDSGTGSAVVVPTDAHATLAPDVWLHGGIQGQVARRAARRRLVWYWYIAGHDRDQIRAALRAHGYGQWTDETIRADIQAEASRRIPRETPEQLRAIEVARYDEIVRAWWPIAVQGHDPYAAPIVLRALDNRARVLGLHEHVPAPAGNRPLATVDGEQLRAWAARLATGPAVAGLGGPESGAETGSTKGPAD